MMTNNLLFGVCIKLGEITNNIVGTKQEIVPGELVKMFEVNRAEKSNSYVIKLYDRPNKRFTRELYQCDKAIINQLNENTFSYASELTEGNNITVNLDMPEGKTKVNFSIKSIGINVPQLGAGYFFALDFIDTPNLSEDIKRSIQLKYFVHKESALCIRGDRLIERMIIYQPSIIQPVISSKPNNYNPQVKPKITAELPPLISFDDGTDIITKPPPLRTYVVPPLNSNPYRKIEDNRHAIPNDPQLQHLHNGLNDLAELTKAEPNGMNEYANNNQINTMHLYSQQWNNRVEENTLLGSTINNRHSTPASNNYFNAASNVKDFRVSANPSPAAQDQVPASIMRKVAERSNANLIVQGDLLKYNLPTVQLDEKNVIDAPSNQMNHEIFENQLQTNNMNQNSSPITKIVNNKPKPRKSRNRFPVFSRNRPNQNKTCYICHEINNNAVQLDCQHLFCPTCMIKSLTDLTNAHCPFKNGKYVCNYKLGVEDIKYIVDSINNSMAVSNTKNTHINTPEITPESKPAIKKVDEEFFVYDDGNSNEVFFVCKQPNCKGGWFVDKTEGRNTYPCPICETYNCFRCQAIHENMTCEEYNQHNLGNQGNNNSRLGNLRISNDIEFNQNTQNKVTWRCDHCTCNENLMDSAVCKVCAKTNVNIMSTRKSTATEYYRLLELEENDNFVPNFYEFECIICTEMIEADGGIQLRGCLHNFCRNCISRYIESQDTPEIVCPFDGCTNLLEDREIKTLVTPQIYARHLEISLRVGKTQIKNGYQCCVTNCPGWWIFTDGTYEYNCPACKAINCISCKASHAGVDCKTYQQNLFYSTDKNGVETRQRLEQMLKVGEAEHCPKCNIIVVKNGGCAHMKCSMCRFDFQWGQTRDKNLNIK